jgi:hypothetical protein
MTKFAKDEKLQKYTNPDITRCHGNRIYKFNKTINGDLMIALEELEKEVMALTKTMYADFRKWFLEQDFANWDKEIKQDSESGKLDFLIQEAQSEMKSGNLKPL